MWDFTRDDSGSSATTPDPNLKARSARLNLGSSTPHSSSPMLEGGWLCTAGSMHLPPSTDNGGLHGVADGPVLDTLTGA